jgi:thiol-disulfide isomerase/thioredoxin
LKIYCDADKYRFEGAGKDSDFLSQLEAWRSFTWPRYFDMTLDSKTNLDLLLERELKFYNEQSDFLEKGLKAKRLVKESYDAIKTELYYKHLTALLAPFSQPLKSLGVQISPKYRAYLFNIRNEINTTWIESVAYRKFLFEYNRFLAYEFTRSPNDFEILYAKAKEHFIGINRDFIMFSLLKQNKGRGLPNYGDFESDFLKNCNTEKFRSYYAKLMKRYHATLEGELLTDALGHEEKWTDVIKKQKSKVIYIDFWATWCGPCLAEMPFSKQVSDSLKEEAIVFIYISIDDNQQAWLKKIKSLPALSALHYRISKSGELAKVFKLPPIPRYAIIDKDGKIAAIDAPRPSDPIFLELVNQYLKQ